jgi:cytochrome c553
MPTSGRRDIAARRTPKSRLSTLAHLVCAALTLASSPGVTATTEDTAVLCGSCHGREGLPADEKISIIWGQQEAYLAKQLQDYRNGARNSQIMSSVAESLGDDIPAIAGYFASKPWPKQLTKEGPGKATNSAPAEACKGCHKERFEGGIAAEYAVPRLAGQFSAYTLLALDAMAGHGWSNTAEAMISIAKALKPAQREELARYLEQQ